MFKNFYILIQRLIDIDKKLSIDIAYLKIQMSQLLQAQQIYYIGEKYKLYAGTFILTIGLISNISIILIFTSLRLFRGNPTSFYFIIESISDIGLLLTLNIPRFVTYFLDYAPSQIPNVWCKIQNMMLQAFALCSLFTVCFLSFDQYLSTNLRAHW